MKKWILAAGLFWTVLCLSGCMPEPEIEPEEEEIFHGMESSPVLSYGIPQQIPGILTDMSGYEQENRKTVLFRGKEIPEEFDVIDSRTGKKVMTGQITNIVYLPRVNEYYGTGDITDLKTPGEYSLQCELLGSSYSFPVSEDLYEKEFNGLLIGFSDENVIREAATEELCNCLSVLLLSYEIGPDAYGDGMIFETNGVPDLLDEAALLASVLSERQDMETGQVEECTKPYAGAMAKFSYLYQDYDNEFATECLKLADLAWQYPEEENTGGYFFAAAELYRASGRREYRQKVEKTGNEILESGDFPDDYALCGAMTYLSTKRSVDVELCTLLMKKMMSVAEEIIDTAKENRYPDANEGEKKQEILSETALLSVGNFISRNREYAVIIEDKYHYMRGRNPWSEDYLKDADLKDKSYFLMVLCQMLQAGLEA